MTEKKTEIILTCPNVHRSGYNEEYSLYLEEAIDVLENIIYKRIIELNDSFKSKLSIDENSENIYDSMKSNENVSTSLIVTLKKHKGKITSLLERTNKIKDRDIEVSVTPHPNDEEFELALNVKCKKGKREKQIIDYLDLYGHSKATLENNVEYTFVILYLLDVLLNNPYRTN